ncbi:glutathione S-transferase family protein [Acuticoccus mangrovi]|uniref:Glutathione S-transferase family protein n=1 Tax=Acuticoccus mangrovi TaxID=2796142 RepID=A0A934IQ58_9HYPH|nr:glutathione S-transferase family protein [Acuticoccus mangrovi]MBJ3776675.1 glutathione S-transferase family protein [Acuticoccus mangrovi]
MKLYSTPATPFGRTVEVVAHELGLHEDIEVIATKVAPTNPNLEYQQFAPLRKIPALVTEEGKLIVDSPVIAEYLAARVGDTALFAQGQPSHFDVMTRYAIARGATECCVASRYEIAVRPPELRWDKWIEDQFDRVGAALTMFEATPPTSGGRLTIADISLAVLLLYLDFRFDDYGWRSRYPTLVAWLEPIAARPSFVATKAS